jgi:hypothetical protein
MQAIQLNLPRRYFARRYPAAHIGDAGIVFFLAVEHRLPRLFGLGGAGLGRKAFAVFVVPVAENLNEGKLKAEAHRLTEPKLFAAHFAFPAALICHWR